MSDQTSAEPIRQKTPGIVLFTVVLNFIYIFFIMLIGVTALAGLVFGNVMGLYDFMTKQITELSPTPNFTYGLSFILAVTLAFCAAFAGAFIALAIGLLKGKRLAWYFQVALSVIGLLGFPFYTIINGLILFFFFRAPVREYFKV